ncbi:diguanylate cyclase [Alcaligenaceae bacterium]|nr:diguanylate cyclase [Alcaligenaceae bacterium]
MIKNRQKYPFVSSSLFTSMRRQCVLIVDDADININNGSLALEGMCEVISAKSGTLAIRLAKERRPDLVLLNINMPGTNGFDIIRTLKSDQYTRHIPVIFMSKVESEAEEAESFALGATDYIAFPQNATILQARVSIHLHADMQRKVLERLSQVDGLTGVLNRRAFDDSLHQHFNAVFGSDKPLTLLLMDIDHFKHINDTLGHLRGDDALRLVATTIAQQVNPELDIVARYGGDEFACLLPDTDQADAWKIAEKIRLAVNRLEVGDRQAGTTRLLTVSIGIASTFDQLYSSCQDLIAYADQRLYDAKKQGRNKVAS